MDWAALKPGAQPTLSCAIIQGSDVIYGLNIVAITGKQKRYLRGLAHNQRVIVTVGTKGLTDDLLGELNTALDHHELLKIRLPASPKTQHQELLQSICSATDSELVQVIGHIGVIFRSADPPKISLPG